ncbi:MAG: helix-turn-helix domain-containing protein, partial [Mucinivorans sp.]
LPDDGSPGKDDIAALKRNRGNRREAASELFMSERTLYRKIKDLGIE